MTTDHLALAKRLEADVAEFQNDLQSDLEHGHLNSVARRWAERRAMPDLREAAAALRAADEQVERVKRDAEGVYDEHLRSCAGA